MGGSKSRGASDISLSSHPTLSYSGHDLWQIKIMISKGVIEKISPVCSIVKLAVVEASFHGEFSWSLSTSFHKGNWVVILHHQIDT